MLRDSGDGFAARCAAEFREDSLHVGIHRSLRNGQSLTNLSVREAPRDQLTLSKMAATAAACFLR